ncbi:MAG: phosphoribosylaminoimidazolesuccinocarboxamide synthase [Elusimicrobia bacterium]|nr:phosphoribosylaminoimidazolesuccinocarboxamide synthase [Elusimicrobiota bacterium]
MANSATGPDLGLEPSYQGKVRDLYDLGDKLLLVATDRISAFDHVLSPAIPDKGRILTRISAYWFQETKGMVPNHVVSHDLAVIAKALPKGARLDPAEFEGRVTLARKAERVDAECVVRGYLVGSGWKEYKKGGTVCGHALPAGLQEAQRLPEPIFTPSTKADQGHDENISRERLAEMVGADLARRLEGLSLKLYKACAQRLAAKGLILADTKFEFGFIDGELCVIDEMVTPDSSRMWDAATYRAGKTPESFDKQPVRDFLEASGWDKNPPAPTLPPAVVAATAARYREALARIVS